MKMLIAGAGPAGLYLAYLVKRQLPGWQVRVVEQNPRDSTFGFGVVFSERALEFLRADDPETYDRITPAMEAWTDITVVHRGAPVVIDGIGFSAIGRLKFLQLLRGQLERAGVAVEFEKNINSENLNDYDLVVAADGANSAIRKTADFGTTVTPLTNKFAWFGSTKVFPTLTQTFVQNDAGLLQRAPLPAFVLDEHLRVRVRRGDLGARRVRAHGRARDAGVLREGFRRCPRRAQGWCPTNPSGVTSPGCATGTGQSAIRC